MHLDSKVITELKFLTKYGTGTAQKKSRKENSSTDTVADDVAKYTGQ